MSYNEISERIRVKKRSNSNFNRFMFKIIPNWLHEVCFTSSDKLKKKLMINYSKKNVQIPKKLVSLPDFSNRHSGRNA